MTIARFKYMTESGPKDGEFALDDYRLAARHNLSAAQLLAARYSDADPKFGTVFEQGLESLGVHLRDDPRRGIRATTVAEMLDGTATKMAGETLTKGGMIVTPSAQGTTPATRLFFPETVLQVMNEKLTEDYGPELAMFSRMISATETIGSEQFTQPLIDVTAPRSERSKPISQNALPKTMISITASQYSKSIATQSIGLQISDQAVQRASIDLVGTIMAQQASGERFAELWEDIGEIVTGNTDAGQSALTVTDINAYDTAAGGGVITQLAWLKMLYRPDRKVSYDSCICTIDTFLDIQNRTGRPQVYDASTTGPNVGALGTYGLNVEPNLLNWSVGVPNVLIVPDGTLPAQQVLLLDSRYGLRRVVNSSASYSAIESMVLQRSTFYRVDYGEMLYRLMDDAFLLVDYSGS